MIPGFKQPSLAFTRQRLKDHRPDEYERLFRKFVAALKVGDFQQAEGIRQELTKLTTGESDNSDDSDDSNQQRSNHP